MAEVATAEAAGAIEARRPAFRAMRVTPDQPPDTPCDAHRMLTRTGYRPHRNTGTSMSLAQPAFTGGLAAPATPAVEARIAGLDGLRGFMTIVVVLSHYFGELPGGFRMFMLGWIAVDVFFILSGFLVGRLIIDKGDRDNFLSIFYIRRVCRTFPIYFICVLGAYGLISWQDAAWNDMAIALPFWSYLTFTQNIFFAAHTSTGAHWISPTWTMAVEEQFYLLAPALMLLTPARRLVAVLLSVAIAAMLFRMACTIFEWPRYAGMALLPARADTLALGLLAAVIFMRGWWTSERALTAMRASVPLLVAGALAIRVIEGQSGLWFSSVGFFMIAVAGALYILSIARGAPERDRFENDALRFCGHNSFAIYLTHMPILWLAHGLWLGRKPSIETLSGVIVTLACIPVCIAISRALTRFVEEPFTAFGMCVR
jgi:peptidoglycan/LPS O-acetylase OafA/YrhL